MNNQLSTTIYIEPRKVGFANYLITELRSPRNGRHMEIVGKPSTNQYLRIVVNPSHDNSYDGENFISYVRAQLA